MDERLKERLTGAVILVALVVIVVPELFGGRPAAAPLETALGNAPVDMVTVTVPDPAGQPEVAQRAPETKPAPAAQPVLAAQPALTAQPVLKVQPAPAAQPVPAASPEAAKPVPEAIPAPTVRRGFAVQLGSFRERANAERMVTTLSARGYQVTAAGPDDRGYYRVRTEVRATRAAAIELQQRLSAAGFAGHLSTAP